MFNPILQDGESPTGPVGSFVFLDEPLLTRAIAPLPNVTAGENLRAVFRLPNDKVANLSNMNTCLCP